MDVTGSIGSDWFNQLAPSKQHEDGELRAWRDFLEDQLKLELQLDADFTLAKQTRFVLNPNSAHTVTEIESFARRALDQFLNARSRT